MSKGDISDVFRQWNPEERGEWWNDAEAKLEGESDNGEPLPEWMQFESVEALPDEAAETIIHNLLRVGEKLGITSGSKNFKTWFLLYIAYCIANGLDCLGFKTCKSKVILFDLELSRYGIKRRLLRIQEKLGVGSFENLKVCALRGKASKFCKAFHAAQSLIKKDGFKVVIIDPIYKFLLGKEENSNGVVADMLDNLTVFCMEAKVALIYVHHHSKGNQADKDSKDRGSGAGAWSRDPDALLDLAHQEDFSEEERVYSCAINVRDFPPIADFVVRWEFPILVRDESGRDPSKLQQPKKAGRAPGDIDERIITTLRVAECMAGLSGLTAGQIVKSADIPRRTFYNATKRLIPGRMTKCVAIKGYQLSVDERRKVSESTDEHPEED